jgi:hypothetical protein
LGNPDFESKPQRTTLEEIPLPQINSDKIIYWVDDNHAHAFPNREIAKKFTNEGI